ncbi:MAG: DUF2194 domain-containing protein [Actinobacteria bacterium]|nr:DUF2194 domain-containing protein [Actinomycetota bacterium]
MYIKKLAVIIISVFILAAGFQLLRSFGVVKLIKNVNLQEELPSAKSPSIPANTRFEKYLIIYDEKDANSIKTAEQLKKVLEYMKKDYQAADVYQEVSDISDFDCVFFAFERLDFLKNLQDYIKYVNQGGKLVFLVRPLTDKSFESIKILLGIKEYSRNMININGIRMLSDVLLGLGGFETSTKTILNSSINLKLNPVAELYITSYDKIPLLWKENYGNGFFIIFNGTMLNEKNNRGLLAGIISLARKDLIYPIVNIKMVDIDDFPAPIPKGRDEKIYEEFNRDITQFYREVWWSEMIKISKKYDIRYSCFVIESYNNNTTPPFKKADSEKMQNLLIYGKELLESGGEIGLHGYNHQSLAPEGYIKQNLGYIPWKNKENMSESIRELIRFIHGVFGKYTLRAYVPPSNILSSEGRQAAIEANPDLKIIASVYNRNPGGDAYVQEFEIAKDGIIEFPRISAGYERSDAKMWSIYNGVNLYGIFAHFVHPDDILDSSRTGGKSWTQLSKEFESIIGEVNKRYNWLRGFTISSASQELIKYLESKPSVEYSNNNIKIYTNNFRNNIYCLMRTDSVILESKNCDYLKISNNAYLLTLKDPVCELKLAVNQ